MTRLEVCAAEVEDKDIKDIKDEESSSRGDILRVPDVLVVPAAHPASPIEG
ncbi:MAG: hypothetical protein JF614_29840 [Acidobacteria bacterium]|nr:hypothetical protein [Acidobacteriota bacterium]